MHACSSFLSRLLVMAVATALLAPLAQADSIGLSISADSAELSYNTGGDYSNSIDWGVTGYYNSVDTEDDQITNDAMLTLDLETSLEGDSSSRLIFSLGGNLFLLSTDRIPFKNADVKTDISAGIMLGGKVGYLFTTSVPSLFYIGGDISPNIINTGRVEYMRRLYAMYEIMLSPAAILQLGYRNYYVDFDKRYDHFEDPNKTFEDRVVGGIKIRF